MKILHFKIDSVLYTALLYNPAVCFLHVKLLIFHHSASFYHSKMLIDKENTKDAHGPYLSHET